MKFHNCKIAITGDLGSGKSTVAQILSGKLGFEIVSTGRIQRQMAERMGLSTLELNQLAEKDPSIDEQIDSIFKSLNEDPNNYIIDSRLAWHFVPSSFKVYLTVDPRTAARRILSDPGRKSEGYHSDEEALALLQARKNSENERFKAIYGVDCADLNNYDLVIDTTDKSPQQVAEIIIQELLKRC